MAFDAAQPLSFLIRLAFNCAMLHFICRNAQKSISVCVAPLLLCAQRTYSFDIMGSHGYYSILYSNCCIRLIPPLTARLGFVWCGEACGWCSGPYCSLPPLIALFRALACSHHTRTMYACACLRSNTAA